MRLHGLRTAKTSAAEPYDFTTILMILTTHTHSPLTARPPAWLCLPSLHCPPGHHHLPHSLHVASSSSLRYAVPLDGSPSLCEPRPLHSVRRHQSDGQVGDSLVCRRIEGRCCHRHCAHRCQLLRELHRETARRNGALLDSGTTRKCSEQEGLLPHSPLAGRDPRRHLDLYRAAVVHIHREGLPAR